jgi:phosphoribosylanthranilate isomerase
MPPSSATSRTRVKICGITRPEDAAAAAELGADAIGLVFYAPSPRHVTATGARAIIAALPPFVTVVGLFFDAADADVRAALDQVPLDVLQFHGDEAPEFCAAFWRPWIKAVRIRDSVDLHAAAARYAAAQALLLDHYVEGIAGGTGKAFDWSRVPVGLHKPVILAGGLTPENVAGAIAAVHPYGVDVSSGVEVTKGIKDRAKIAAFIRSVNNAHTG